MRILGIDPNSKGIGFAILESDNKLIDWGTKYLSKQKKNTPTPKASCRLYHREYLLIVENLIDLFGPDAVICEDWTARTCRRSMKTKKLLYQINLLTTKRKIPVYVYSRIQVSKAFMRYGITTKHEIASFLSNLFPELLPQLPRKRKPWMTESIHMNMFTGLSLCFVFNESK
jgi:Holliday junction resolvasome RuvABC endonuclease subunit